MCFLSASRDFLTAEDKEGVFNADHFPLWYKRAAEQVPGTFVYSLPFNSGEWTSTSIDRVVNLTTRFRREGAKPQRHILEWTGAPSRIYFGVEVSRQIINPWYVPSKQNPNKTSSKLSICVFLASVHIWPKPLFVHEMTVISCVMSDTALHSNWPSLLCILPFIAEHAFRMKSKSRVNLYFSQILSQQ